MRSKPLKAAVENFSDVMRARLEEKERDGFAGWNDPAWHTWDISRRMQQKVTEVLIAGDNADPKDLVDIANFAMFLHRKLAP